MRQMHIYRYLQFKFILFQFLIIQIYHYMDQEIPLTQKQPTTQKKKSYQFKALFKKSATLQSKQIGTNICQILTPIICLLFTFLIKTITQKNIKSQQEDFSFPLLFSTPIPTVFSEYVEKDCLQWYQFDMDPTNVDLKNFIGQRNGLNNSKGMLGNIVTEYSQCLYNATNRTQPVSTPYLRQNNNTSINQDLADRINYLNSVKFGTQLNYLPDGAIYFKQASKSKLKAKIMINDCRQYAYHSMNGITRIGLKIPPDQNITDFIIVAEGQLSFMNLINKAYINQLTGSELTSGIIYMPVTPGSVNYLIQGLINIVASTLFPLSLSLLFPVFLYAIVLEKQEKLIQMMKMNGMSLKNYWLVTFLFDLFLSTCTNIIFYGFGRFLLKNRFFTETSIPLMISILLGWSLAQIGMAILFQTFLSNSRSANIIGYLFSIWTSLIATSLNIGVYVYPSTLPVWLRLFAPFGFSRIFYSLLSHCSESACISTFSELTPQIKSCIAFLYIFFIITFLLGIYLHQIIPQQFGVARPILYPLNSIKNLFKKDQQMLDQTIEDEQLNQYINDQDQDEDSNNMRIEVTRFRQRASEYPLICNNLRKLYKKQGRDKLYAAVRSFNIIIQPNMIFGLLGPNGAGKTTLISMITGMFQPDNGNAWVAGHSIKTNIEKVHLQMGVCPQFDLLWPQLTVQQHLYFYARLKGVSSKEEAQKVKLALKEVNLQNASKLKANQLSGGMKRRLSVAISMVGSPKIVFLDEPTTGLDPDNRRQLWSVLAKCKQRCAMFLTTHMMDQADTLCNKIGIITNGVLRTVANQIKLRKSYGIGYRLDINLMRPTNEKGEEMNIGESMLYQSQVRGVNSSMSLMQEQFKERQQEKQMKQRGQKLKLFIQENFEDSRLVKIFNNNFKFRLGNKVVVSEIFDTLEKHKNKLNIAHWGVIKSSLEDVFMTVVQQFDKQQILKEQQNQKMERKSQKSRKNSVQLEVSNGDVN